MGTGINKKASLFIQTDKDRFNNTNIQSGRGVDIKSISSGSAENIKYKDIQITVKPSHTNEYGNQEGYYEITQKGKNRKGSYYLDSRVVPRGYPDNATNYISGFTLPSHLKALIDDVENPIVQWNTDNAQQFEILVFNTNTNKLERFALYDNMLDYPVQGATESYKPEYTHDDFRNSVLSSVGHQNPANPTATGSTKEAADRIYLSEKKNGTLSFATSQSFSGNDHSLSNDDHGYNTRQTQYVPLFTKVMGGGFIPTSSEIEGKELVYDIEDKRIEAVDIDMYIAYSSAEAEGEVVYFPNQQKVLFKSKGSSDVKEYIVRDALSPLNIPFGMKIENDNSNIRAFGTKEDNEPIEIENNVFLGINQSNNKPTVIRLIPDDSLKSEIKDDNITLDRTQFKESGSKSKWTIDICEQVLANDIDSSPGNGDVDLDILSISKVSDDLGELKVMGDYLIYEIDKDKWPEEDVQVAYSYTAKDRATGKQSEGSIKGVSSKIIINLKGEADNGSSCSPTATDDTFTLAHTQLSGNRIDITEELLENDIDCSGSGFDALNIGSVDSDGVGIGKIVYDKGRAYYEIDPAQWPVGENKVISFTYKPEDMDTNNESENPAQVNITLEGKPKVEPEPGIIALPDKYQFTHGEAGQTKELGVLSNDDGNNLEIKNVTTSTNSKDPVTRVVDGNYIAVTLPSLADWPEEDKAISYTYTLEDSATGEEDQSTVYITLKGKPKVEPEPDIKPLPDKYEFTHAEAGQTKELNVLNNDQGANLSIDLAYGRNELYGKGIVSHDDKKVTINLPSESDWPEVDTKWDVGYRLKSDPTSQTCNVSITLKGKPKPSVVENNNNDPKNPPLFSKEITKQQAEANRGVFSLGSIAAISNDSGERYKEVSSDGLYTTTILNNGQASIKLNMSKWDEIKKGLAYNIEYTRSDWKEDGNGNEVPGTRTSTKETLFRVEITVKESAPKPNPTPPNPIPSIVTEDCLCDGKSFESVLPTTGLFDNGQKPRQIQITNTLSGTNQCNGNTIWKLDKNVDSDMIRGELDAASINYTDSQFDKYIIQTGDTLYDIAKAFGYTDTRDPNTNKITEYCFEKLIKHMKSYGDQLLANGDTANGNAMKEIGQKLENNPNCIRSKQCLLIPPANEYTS